VHAVPQAVVSVSATHMSLQLCVPVGQAPTHAALVAIHWLKQTFWPVGQLDLHAVPSQVAFPPVGIAHGEHAAPQLFGESFATQALLHWCVPLGQLHTPLVQVPPVGQSAAEQHADVEMHVVPQSFVPWLH